MDDTRFKKLVLLIFAISLVLRLWGIDHGLPHIYIPDTTSVRAAMSIGSGLIPFQGDLLPTQYPYVLPYVLFILYGVVFVLGYLVGIFENMNDFKIFSFNNYYLFFLIARIFIAFVSSSMVIVVAYAGRRTMDNSIGIASAFFTATSLMIVQMSHQARPHIVATFFIVMSFYCLTGVIKERGRKNYLASWLFCALATSTVPYGLMSLVFPILSTFSLEKMKRIPLFIQGFVLFLVTNLFFFPSMIYRFRNLLNFSGDRDVFSLYEGLVFKHSLINGKGFSKLMSWLFFYEPVLLIFALGGIVICIKGRKTNKNLFHALLYPLFFFCVYGMYEVIHPRYIASMLPFLSLFSGYCLVLTWRYIYHLRLRRIRFIVMCLMAVLLFHPLIQVFRLDLLLHRIDTRALAEEWIEQNIENTKRIGIEAHGVELLPDEKSLKKMYQDFRKKLGLKDLHLLSHGHLTKNRSRYHIVRFWYTPRYKSENIGEVLGKHTLDYIVIAKKWKKKRDDLFYTSLRDQATMVKRISPLLHSEQKAETSLPTELQNPLTGLWKVNRCGPIIEIFKVQR